MYVCVCIYIYIYIHLQPTIVSPIQLSTYFHLYKSTCFLPSYYLFTYTLTYMYRFTCKVTRISPTHLFTYLLTYTHQSFSYPRFIYSPIHPPTYTDLPFALLS